MKYVGAERCGVCHSGREQKYIYERWSLSPHAQAYSDLSWEERRLVKCLGCHTTGYWERDKWFRGLTMAELQGVQCEACHGPGSRYRKPDVMNLKFTEENPLKQRNKKIASGLKYPTLDDCKKCHNEKCPKYKPLVIEKPLIDIAHPQPRGDIFLENEP